MNDRHGKEQKNLEHLNNQGMAKRWHGRRMIHAQDYLHFCKINLNKIDLI
jgi:hypothetical protein